MHLDDPRIRAGLASRSCGRRIFFPLPALILWSAAAGALAAAPPSTPTPKETPQRVLDVTLLPPPPAAAGAAAPAAGGAGTRGAGDAAAGPAAGSAGAPGAGAPPPSPVDWRSAPEDQSARRAARAQESARENRVVWWAILTLAALLL